MWVPDMMFRNSVGALISSLNFIFIFYRFVPRDKMTQKCDPVIREECGMTMRTDCTNLCKEDCQDKDKKVCMTVPHQECEEKAVENCQDVPNSKCRKVRKKLTQPLNFKKYIKIVLIII